MLCRICQGSGSIQTFHEGKPEFWNCPCCGGAGVSIQNGPAEIHIIRLNLSGLQKWKPNKEKFRKKGR